MGAFVATMPNRLIANAGPLRERGGDGFVPASWRRVRGATGDEAVPPLALRRHEWLLRHPLRWSFSLDRVPGGLSARELAVL